MTLATGAEGALQPASGSSFYAAMRILPRERRDAMMLIYGFCRAVDDIADDGEASGEARLDALARWRGDLEALYAGEAGGRVAPLEPAIRRFDLERADFLAIIDGMEMDVRETIRAPSAQTLDLYCDRVASAVGRLSVRVFGVDRREGPPLAHHLGRALQLTNILRDLDEDAEIGRLYLPREALENAGIASRDPAGVLASPHLSLACEHVTRQARDHFQEANAIMRRCARETVRAPRIMGEVYEGILDRLVARGWRAPRKRIRTPRSRVLLAALKYGIV